MVPSNHSNFQYCDSNIGLFSIAPFKVTTLNPLSILFGISSSLLFYGSNSKVIALPTIAIAIVVALISLLKEIAIILPLLLSNAFKSVESDEYCSRNSWKSDNYMGSITEKKLWTNLQNKTNTKNEAKRLSATTFAIAKFEER